MRIFVTLVCLCVSVAAIIAQPTFTRDHLFASGDVIFDVESQSVPDPGDAGADVIWDFSGLEIDTQSIVSVRFGLPDTTAYFGQFPNSNLVQIVDFQGLKFYQFMNVNNALAEIHGEVIPGTSITRYSNPETILQFPVSYNGQWEDDYVSTFTFLISPIMYDEEGTNTTTVDGYGTVMLPQATFDDALRMKTINVSTDTASLGQGLFERNYYFDTTYVWLSPSYIAPLCVHSHGTQQRFVYLVTQDTVITDQELTSFETFSFDPMAQLTSAVRPVLPGSYALQISPNPFSSALHLTFDSEKPLDMQFILRDLNGRNIFTSNIYATTGQNIVDLQVHEIPAGVYVALLQSAEGADVQKLIRLGAR